MTDRTELLETALDSLPEGIALIGAEGQTVFWNRAAEAVTGYSRLDLLSRPVPEPLESLLLSCEKPGDTPGESDRPTGRGLLIRFEHKLGHQISVIARSMVLRDEMGGRVGLATVFHPAESLDALPHGESSEGTNIEDSQAEFEDRLTVAFDDFVQGGEGFGVLWITVDQAHDLRRSHGMGACEAMLAKVERAISNGLRPSEAMARWGDDEFLILAHERTPEMLAAHAQALAGLGRTADFRWWGDRVSITVSIGAAQADRSGSLVELLERAKASMFSSYHAGGNRISLAPGRQECSPS